jgi:uncharacterized membrane protein
MLKIILHFIFLDYVLITPFNPQKGETNMIDLIYQLMEKIGYLHPIHPPFTHIPMGLVIGAFIFALVALLFRRSVLPSIAYRRIIFLAFIFAIPTALFGYMDWQHFYDGEWLFVIKIKLVLTGIFIILLLIELIGRKKGGETKRSFTIYTLCFLTIAALGYFGGQLVFEGEGRPEKVPMRFLVGEKLFAANCNDCHPRGGDILNAPQLLDFKKFTALLHDPPNGMTRFSPEQITDQKAMRLYLYLVQLSGQKKK